MKIRVWPVAAALGVCLLVGARLKPPLDVGTWSTEALSGEAVLALAPDSAGVLVGTRSGLYRLVSDGGLSEIGSVGRVQALAVEGDRAWIGTDKGVLTLSGDRLGPGPEGLARTAVHGLDVDADNGRVLVASDEGVHELTDDGVTRLWPLPEDEPTLVTAVVATTSGILFAGPEGLARVEQGGRVSIVLPDVDVLALGQLDDPERVWAGMRGAPLLAGSDDGGRTWTPRNEGLGFSAVNAMVTDPARDGHLMAGGSGLADGTGNAGAQWSLDGARTWHTEQDRLSNTHVFAMAAAREPVRVSLGLPVTDVSISIPLPVTTTRWYAGTNGSGVATMRPDLPVLDGLAAAGPSLRLAEPLLLGALLVAVLLPAYRTLARNRAAGRAPPSSPTHPTN